MTIVSEGTRAQMTGWFRAWCVAHGLRACRTVLDVGDARLICRRGRYTIEVARHEDEGTFAARCRGALPGEVVIRGLGYDYPLIDAVEGRAASFFGAEPRGGAGKAV